MNDDAPDGLDECGGFLWRAAAAALERFGADHQLAAVCLHIRQALRLEAKANRLQVALDARDATLRMACDRLGGLVEGSPPHPGNFLQRIDELVKIEAGHSRS